MTEKRHVKLPRSNKAGKKPKAEELEYGEIAVNYSAGKEFLSVKNSKDEIVTFSSDSSSDNIWAKGTSDSVGCAVLNGSNSVVDGEYCCAEGTDTTATTAASHAEGGNTKAAGRMSHAEGNLTIASGNSSHSEGLVTLALGVSSHAEGYNATAYGNYSHAEGESTSAGTSATSESTSGQGESSHAEGRATKTIGNYSHAEGQQTVAGGKSSHAEGVSAVTSGIGAHAEGLLTKAIGNYSHAAGYYTQAWMDNSFVCGVCNKASEDVIFAVGGGLVSKDDSTGQVYTSPLNLLEIKESGATFNVGVSAKTLVNTSDLRKKEEVKPISDDDIEKVGKITLKSYQFKDDPTKRYGAIAQDVESAGLSNLVSEDEEGFKYLDYISLLVLKVGQLEKEIAELKSQIEKK